jgi:hypothetical protein
MACHGSCSEQHAPRQATPSLSFNVRQRKQALRRTYSPRSAARCCSIQAPPALSFFANGDLGSTTRQNGATSLVGTPDSISSQAASATVRRKIAVDTGHVASAPWNLASSRLICCTSRVSPDGTCCLKYCSTSTGQEIRSFAPAGTPAKSFSRVTVWGGFAAIFCFQLLGLLGIVRSFARHRAPYRRGAQQFPQKP